MHQSFSRKHANKRAHSVMNATGGGTAPGGTGTGVRLVRCVIDSVSLRTKATFSDNSSLVLDTRGRAFAAYVPKYAQHKSTSNAKAGHGHGIAPKTVCTRQLCRFCVSEHRPRVALALAFRNNDVAATATTRGKCRDDRVPRRAPCMQPAVARKPGQSSGAEPRRTQRNHHSGVGVRPRPDQRQRIRTPLLRRLPSAYIRRRQRTRNWQIRVRLAEADI